ncbi:hypothetical protein ACWCQ1_31515 [Streptomyces sp. NPDC002144]|uniref:hypothetical protein n=1 Tax=Streptomyces sp. NPDC006668 TaxID=3156903 RepID=UPI0033E9F58E
MGERQSEGGAPGRRRAHHDGSVSGAGQRADGPELEFLLAGVMRSAGVDGEAEQRAVAAFREARDAGAHRARTRRRDDWRPRERTRTRRSLRATLTLSLAGLTLGGVAFAAIGTVGSSGPDHKNPPQAQPTAPTTHPSPRGSDGSTAPGSAHPAHPSTAQDTEAHCKAYEHVKGNGKALQSTAWQRLITAAGGEANVAAYCAEQLGLQTATPMPGSGKGNGADDAGKSGNGKSADKGNGNGGNGKNG